ncbi:MAG: hypothetical protein LBP26_01785 [Clostridiales bacterium]|jgi:fluoride ion exporter CrcB/FEX|nr:hypothetical protein [Clostridiales bacterium]
MILQPLLFFLSAAALGGFLRVPYFLQRALAKKTALPPVTIILDFLWCLLAFGSLFLFTFFVTGGEFRLFIICGILAGFFTVSIWL